MDDPVSPDQNIEEKWHLLSTLLNRANPLFDQTYVLFGYDYSSNIFLIQGEYLSLVDAGNDYTAFMQLLDQGFQLPDIKKIVLTHGHQDHVMGSIELFRGYPGYKISDMEIILHEAAPPQYKEIVQELGCRLTEVKGGERINLSGCEFEVIHTPGHTLDGISLYHEPTKTLFSGDTILPHAMAEIDAKGGGRMDHYLYSLRTLLAREVDHVLPGHGGVAPFVGKRVLEETYEGLIKRAVGPEVGWMEGATTLAQRGLLTEALFYCHKELADHPQNLRALETKAFLLHDLGRLEEAVETFDKVLEKERGQIHAIMGKGLSLLKLGKYQESEQQFDQVLAINPDDQDAKIHKGIALTLSGKPEEAMKIEEFHREYMGRIKEFLEKSKNQE